MNPLLHAREPVGQWLKCLEGVSSKLYDIAPAAWAEFEPARKRLSEAISWLDYEGKLDLSATSVSEAINVADLSIPRIASAWRIAAKTASDTLGTEVLRDLIERSHGEVPHRE